MGPIWDAELRVWDAKNFGLVSPGTHRNKFVKKSLSWHVMITSDDLLYIIVPPTFPFKRYTLIYNIKIAKIIKVNEKCLNHLLFNII